MVSLKKTLFTVFIVLSTSVSAYDGAENSSLQYYRDGVYDTTAQINKHLRNGLQEQVMDQYINRYLVMTDLEKFSFVDILFFETIAEKNHILDVSIVKNIQTDKSYMVFGGYERKADADMIADKLTESGVNTNVKLNQEVFIKNPIVVKKFLGDIREMIKDMPVKIVKIEKTISKEGGSLTPAALDRPPSIDNFKLQNEFLDIDRRWKSSGGADTQKTYIVMHNSKLNKMSYFGLDEKIGCFTLASIERDVASCSTTIRLLSPDGKTLTSTRQRTDCGVPSVKKPQPVKPKGKPTGNAIIHIAAKHIAQRSTYCPDDVGSTEKPSAQKSASVAQEKQASSTVFCDFTKIKFGDIGGKNTAIASSQFAGKRLSMEVKKLNGSYTLSASGLPNISVREKFYNEGCSK